MIDNDCSGKLNTPDPFLLWEFTPTINVNKPTALKPLMAIISALLVTLQFVISAARCSLLAA